MIQMKSAVKTNKRRNRKGPLVALERRLLPCQRFNFTPAANPADRLGGSEDCIRLARERIQDFTQTGQQLNGTFTILASRIRHTRFNAIVQSKGPTRITGPRRRGPFPAMKRIKLLVVDDNAAEAYLVLYALEDSPKPVKLYRAKDATEGLQLLSERKFDLVILDLNLPGLSGFGFLEQCDPTRVPVVMFSVSSNPADAERALALGAREFVRKPVGLEAYRHAVLTMIEKWVLVTDKKSAGV